MALISRHPAKIGAGARYGFLAGTVAALVILTIGAGASAAQTDDWRFCLAPAQAKGRIYLTPPFLTNRSVSTLESEFDSALTRQAIAHKAVQCPRGDQQTISEMHAQAVQFNRERGRVILPFNWRP